jgi:hypothetical protein
MRQFDPHTTRLTPTQKRLVAIIASFSEAPTERQITLRFKRWAAQSPRFPRRTYGADRG